MLNKGKAIVGDHTMGGRKEFGEGVAALCRKVD